MSHDSLEKQKHRISIHLFVYVSVCLSTIYLSTIYLYTYPSNYLFTVEWLRRINMY